MRRVRIQIMGVFVAVTVLVRVPPAMAQKGDLAIANATLIDGTGAAARDEGDDSRSRRRDRERRGCEHGNIPDGTRLIDATGKFVIPGLADMHVHFGTGGLLPFDSLTVDRVLRQFLFYGVTTIFNVGATGGGLEDVLNLRTLQGRGSSARASHLCDRWLAHGTGKPSDCDDHGSAEGSGRRDLRLVTTRCLGRPDTGRGPPDSQAPGSGRHGRDQDRHRVRADGIRRQSSSDAAGTGGGSGRGSDSTGAAGLRACDLARRAGSGRRMPCSRGHAPHWRSSASRRMRCSQPWRSKACTMSRRFLSSSGPVPGALRPKS